MNGTLPQLFTVFNKACDSFRREVFYDTLVEFGVPVKEVRIIKVCLNETYSKVLVCIGKYLCYVSYSEWSKTWLFFVAIAFQLAFRIRH
jgi:hypothetical protein